MHSSASDVINLEFSFNIFWPKVTFLEKRFYKTGLLFWVKKSNSGNKKRKRQEKRNTLCLTNSDLVIFTVFFSDFKSSSVITCSVLIRVETWIAFYRQPWPQMPDLRHTRTSDQWFCIIVSKNAIIALLFLRDTQTPR